MTFAVVIATSVKKNGASLFNIICFVNVDVNLTSIELGDIETHFYGIIDEEKDGDNDHW